MSEAPVPPRISAAVPASRDSSAPVRFLGERATEDSLAAELAQERHITLELQRAILPLHDAPF